MSKHLRFGKLLSLLAIMLAFGVTFNSVSAQNLSSVKQVVSFSVPNQVGTTTVVHPNATTGALGSLAITVPYATNLTSLIATFQVSTNAQMYWGKQTAGAMNPSDLMTSGSVTRDYTNGTTSPTTLFVTVEAENHSYDYYAITVTKVAASTAKDIAAFSYEGGKIKACPTSYTNPNKLTDLILSGVQAATLSGTTNYTLSVPYGTWLKALTVYIKVSDLATISPAVDYVNGTAFDFDADNDGVPNSLSFIVTAQNGSTKTYVVTPVINTLPSTEDYLIATGSMTIPSMVFANAVSVTSSYVTSTSPQIITVVLPASATTIAPTWKISDFAHMFKTMPAECVKSDVTTEICSGGIFTLTASKTDTETFDFYIQAENPCEISHWTVVVTNAAPSTANSLLAITGEWHKAQSETQTACGPFSGTPTKTTIAANSVTFDVPVGTTEVLVKAPFIASTATVANQFSYLATSSVIGGTTLLHNGDTFTITSESGVVRTITVVFNYTAVSNAKKLLTYGFNKAQNDQWLFPDWAVTKYEGTITDTDTLKRVNVTVAWNTDLHDLIAYFTVSDFACVTIAESNLMFTPQTSNVTVNDHSNTLTYVVTAQDGTQERYEVIVTKAVALTGKDISAFSLTGLTYCAPILDPATSTTLKFNVAGTITGTAISVLVPNRPTLSLTALPYSLTVSASSTVTAVSNGTYSQSGTTVTGSADFTSPVTITVTAQNSTTQTYTISVAKRVDANNPSNRKQLTKYWFVVNNASYYAVADPNNQFQLEAWVPWGTSMTALKASFELNGGSNSYAGGVVMTHSEDGQYIQTSGVTANDFTTPVAYTVFAEDCSTVEYFVTVHMTPDTSTGISKFDFGFTACSKECPLANVLDAYARRIYITVPFGTNLSSLAPTVITVAPAVGGLSAATVSPAVGVAQDFSAGPVKYTVTAPDGVTKADWMVYVTAPACKAHNITAFSLSEQVDAAQLPTGMGLKPVVIDTTNHKIDVIIKKGATKKAMSYTRSLSCGATICCVGGNCQDNQVLDFSENGCHTCVVTAEDVTVKQDWIICVHEIDVAAPKVTTWSVMAYNCTDSVAVQSTEAGRVFIVNESLLNKTVSPWTVSGYNLYDWTSANTVTTSVAALVAKGMGNYATVSDAQVNTPVYIQTNALYSGSYWAFAVDNYGNISCISDQKLFLDICEKEIATLCDLRSQPDVWRYKLTEEVFVTYEENHTGGNWKFVQDATCGILIEDRLGALPVDKYGEGAGITNLIGLLDKSTVNLEFIPVCCYQPTVSSKGNVVTPISLTWDEYKANCYGSSSSKQYESMLVKVTTPMKVTDGYYSRLTWPYDVNNIYNETDMVVTNALGGNEWGFIQSVLNTPLVGTTIPTGPAYYSGIRTNVNWGSIYGLFTPRKAADIQLITDPIIVANPNPALIGGVVVGNCGTTTVKIINQGAGTLNITALYLDDAAATDGFNLLTPPTVPFTIGSWLSQAVNINFCPKVAGNKTTNLIIEYGEGKTLVVPINGTTMLIYPLPFSENFNADTAPAAWSGKNITFGYNGNDLTNGSTKGYYYGWSWITPNSSKPIWLITPGINLAGALHPTLSFRYGTVFSSYMRVDVSTDYSNWTTVKDWGYHTLGNGAHATYSVDLSAYAGKMVYIRFYSAGANYFGIDDVTVQEKITTPLMAVNPVVGDFGGVQVGATGTVSFSLTNAGVSILNIKSVSISGDKFALTDSTAYPVEVTDGVGTWAYTVGNTAKSVTFSASFSPTDIGVKTGMITVVYGLYDDEILEIPLTGEGLSCYTATVATKGRNYAPSQNTWFKYTADKFSLVTINSCDAHQDLVTNEYAWDTYLYVYSNCEGTLIASNDDMEANCVYNRASSEVTIAMNAAETAYIFWPLQFPTAAHAYEEFYWNINVSYPLDGDVCENAIPLTLPVVNLFGTTVGFADDYNSSPCSPYSNYMDGNDKVYTITLAEDGYLTGNILGAYGAIHVLDVCPKAELTKDHCKAYIGGPNGGQFRKKIAAGTYFVIISTWAPPQTVDFLLNMSWESGSAVDNNGLNSSLSVYPNPTDGQFTVSISNTEAMDMTIELVNISGQVVYRNNVKAAYSYNENIDASSFAKGVYYLKVNNGKGVKVEKVVLQ